jgi:hypothetical protein
MFYTVCCILNFLPRQRNQSRQILKINLTGSLNKKPDFITFNNLLAGQSINENLLYLSPILKKVYFY